MQLRGVDPERVHADPGHVPVVADHLPVPVDLRPQHLLAAVHERVGPPLAQEARVVGAEDAVEHLVRRRRPAAA